MDHFFRPPNLEQLRELTLRELAAQIDARRRDPLDQDIPSSPDQVMVCLSSRGPNSEALLRYASRLAGRLNRNWYAVYVQTSRERPTIIDAATQRVLSNTLTLAQQLGATVFTYKGDDVVKTILQFAKEYRVGHIVIGSPGRKMPFWKRLRGESSIVERLVFEGKGMTVVVLDTKTIREERPALEKMHPDKATPEEASQQHKNLALENKTVLSQMTALVWEEALGMEEAIRGLLDSFRHIGKEQKIRALNALLEREQQGGTLVGEDVAIPHARVDGLSQPLIAIGVGKKGVQDLDSGRKAKIIALLLSPVDPPEKHIETLGIISRMAADDQWRKDVLAAGKSAEIMRAIQRWEAGH